MIYNSPITSINTLSSSNAALRWIGGSVFWSRKGRRNLSLDRAIAGVGAEAGTAVEEVVLGPTPPSLSLPFSLPLSLSLSLASVTSLSLSVMMYTRGSE